MFLEYLTVISGGNSNGSTLILLILCRYLSQYALSEIRYKPKMVSSLGSYLVAIEVLFQPPLSKSLLCNGQEPAVLLNFDDVAIICEQLEMSLFVLAPWHWCIVDAIGTSATLLAHFQRQHVLLIGMLFQTRD